MPNSDLPLFNQSKKTQALSVTEFTLKVRDTLEPHFFDVWLVGEISNYKPAAASGHLYFSLKDSQSTVGVAFFGWTSRQKKIHASQRFELKDGMLVLCHGKLSVYPPRGTYQLILDHVEPRGVGTIQLAFEQLKNKLSSEGLFDPAKKRPLPKYPLTVAIITSPTGAAMHDMITTFSRRAPHLKLLIIPAQVQGAGASDQIIAGLKQAQKTPGVEVIVLARGGGSMEDLWSFNDELLAREIAQSAIPVISAVGHETDFTIADFVADVRAATPSIAAELLSSTWVEAKTFLQDIPQRLQDAIVRSLKMRQLLLEKIAQRLISPKDRLREQIQRCDELNFRLEQIIQFRLSQCFAMFEKLTAQLQSLSPLRVLERGYSIVRSRDSDGTLIKSVKQLKKEKDLRITFSDGEGFVRVL